MKFKEVCHFFQENELHLTILFNTKKHDWKKMLGEISEEISKENDKIRLKNEESERKNKTARGRKSKILPLKEIWNDTDLRKGLIQMSNHILSSTLGLKIESTDTNKNGNNNGEYKCYSPLFKKWNLNIKAQALPRLLGSKNNELITEHLENDFLNNTGLGSVNNSEVKEENKPSMKPLLSEEDEETALLREMASNEKAEKERQKMICLEYNRKIQMQEINRQWQVEQKQKARERYQKKKQLKALEKRS
jgi:hypothetical protein